MGENNIYLFVQASLILFSVTCSPNSHIHKIRLPLVIYSTLSFQQTSVQNTYSLDTNITFFFRAEWDVNNFSLRFVAVSLYFSFPEMSLTALLHYFSS